MTAKIIEAAMKEMDVKGRALVLTLASSGARLNEILSLRISDVDFESNPVKLTIRGKISKNGQTRFTFISSEAALCDKACHGKAHAQEITKSKLREKIRKRSDIVKKEIASILRKRTKVREGDDPIRDIERSMRGFF